MTCCLPTAKPMQSTAIDAHAAKRGRGTAASQIATADRRQRFVAMGSLLPGEAPREEAQPHEEAVTSRSIFGVSAMGYGATAADGSRADPQSDCSLSPIPEDSTRELESPAPQQPAQARYAALSKPSSSLRREEEARLQKLFEKADTDGGGTLQLKEIKALCKSMGDRLSTVALEEGFYRMDPEKTGTVDFESFRKWWRLKEDTARRDLRKNVEQVFRMADADASGQLDREEVGMMAAKITNKFAGAAFDPPFDLETDFAAMDVHGNGHVTYEEFAAWFKVRTGDDEPEIPVLPEYLVRKVSHLSARITHVQTIQDVGSFSAAAGAAATVGTENEQATGEERETGEKKEEHNGITGERRPARNGKELWSFLAPRLSVLVTLQKQWGRVSDLYGTGGSMFESNALPESLYDPDSDFAKWWDILQFAALLYIVFVTPMRIGFAEEVPLLSAAFCADAIVDVYFIIDIYLNFNTALWLENGTLETNSRAVRKRYLKGWFALDFLSSFPISYLLLIGRLLAGDTRGERDGYQRLLRLSKVMRLSRFRRVVKKYEDNGAIGDVTPYLGSIATVFIVLFSGHLLTCLWYFAGRSYGSIVCDPTESHLYADLLERISGHGLTPVQCLPMDDPTDGYEFKVPGWVIRQNYPNATTIGTKCE
jgi:Ca2+-binding EF-hand superfamily protein